MWSQRNTCWWWQLRLCVHTVRVGEARVAIHYWTRWNVCHSCWLILIIGVWLGCGTGGVRVLRSKRITVIVTVTICCVVVRVVAVRITPICANQCIVWKGSTCSDERLRSAYRCAVRMSATVAVAMTVDAVCVLCMRLVIWPNGQQVTSLQRGCSKTLHIVRR